MAILSEATIFLRGNCVVTLVTPFGRGYWRTTVFTDLDSDKWDELPTVLLGGGGEVDDDQDWADIVTPLCGPPLADLPAAAFTCPNRMIPAVGGWIQLRRMRNRQLAEGICEFGRSNPLAV